MTPADELLAAADRIDQTRAGVERDHQGGPWHGVESGPITKVRACDSSLIADVVHWSDGAGPAAAAWIALLNPQTGQHIAALLQMAADHAKGRGAACGSCVDTALALARAINGCPGKAD